MREVAPCPAKSDEAPRRLPAPPDHWRLRASRRDGHRRETDESSRSSSSSGWIRGNATTFWNALRGKCPTCAWKSPSRPPVRNGNSWSRRLHPAIVQTSAAQRKIVSQRLVRVRARRRTRRPRADFSVAAPHPHHGPERRGRHDRSFGLAICVDMRIKSSARVSLVQFAEVECLS